MSKFVSSNNSNTIISSNYPVDFSTETREFHVQNLSMSEAPKKMFSVIKSASFWFESYLYSWMDNICKDYKDGNLSHFWNFHMVLGVSKELTADEKALIEDYFPEKYSSKTFYGRIDSDPRQLVDIFVTTNGFQGKMSLDAACITATIFALSNLAELFYYRGKDNSFIVDACDSLKDFAVSHPDSGLIFSAID